MFKLCYIERYHFTYRELERAALEHERRGVRQPLQRPRRHKHEQQRAQDHPFQSEDTLRVARQAAPAAARDEQAQVGLRLVPQGDAEQVPRLSLQEQGQVHERRERLLQERHRRRRPPHAAHQRGQTLRAAQATARIGLVRPHRR